jgi:class 3 adenylate cyclase/tetratricopeptide (TPR) repeat protein
MESGGLGKVYEDGEYAIRQGEVGDCMFVIQEGQVEVVVEKGGKEVRLAVRSEGDFVGEMAIFEREVRSAHVRALGQARVLTVDKKNFLRRVHEDPSLAFRIVQNMSHRIRADNTDQSRYCSQCGKELTGRPARVCPLCEMGNAPDARFCISCGAAVDGAPMPSEDARVEGQSTRSLKRLMPKQYVDQLLAARGRVAGERRVITILFFDIKGSTAMAEKLDPEEVMEIMNGAFEVLSEPVYRYEGTIARLMGDALLCFFGAPITHEDDPDRACRCALDVLAAARSYADRLERERGIPDFNVRVGINTGLVVVGEVGADMRVEYTAMGDAVNLAARMESAAEPGTILITENTHRLIHTAFETESLGSMQVKGRSGPVEVHRILSAKSGSGWARGIEGLHSSLVGRDAELKVVKSSLSELESGCGGVTAVIGDAGLGKSRLVREAHRLSPLPVSWVEGRCLPYTGGMSYYLAKDLLLGLIGATADSDPADIGEALRRSLEGQEAPSGAEDLPCPVTDVANQATGTYPFLAHLLGAPLHAPEAERIRKLEPETLRQRIWEAYRAAIRNRARRGPLAVVLEDLHWVDPSSLRLWESLLPLTKEVPLLVLLVFRQEEGPVWDLHQKLESGQGESYRVISLPPLNRDDSATLLQNLLRVRGMPARFQKLILDRAEGNAFYLEEVLRSLLDEGVVTLQGEEAVFADQTGELEVPETLTGVIMARIDRLPPTEKRTLQTSSVIGRTFARSVLLRLLESEIDEKEVKDSLSELRRREFVLLRGDPGNSGVKATSETPADRRSGSFDTMEIHLGNLEAAVRRGDPEFVFKHAMTAEVAYNSLLLSQRRDLHRRVGEALVLLYPERWEELAPTLAYHFEQAELRDKAFRFLVLAAESAADICANQEAIDAYQRALELVECDGDSGRGESTTAAEELAPVHEGLGDVHYRMSQYPAAMRQYALGLQLTEDARWRAALHRKRGQVCEKWGRFDHAREYFEAGLRELR